MEDETVEEDPTMAQIRNQREERKRRYKAKTCIHSAVTEEVFTRIMACETGKQAWNTLKELYQGNDRTHGCK